ncbi:DAK2 domain-containing protein [Nocardioides sp. YIM 152588]|uniref:DAK2 domain-containing protein n=1 Tax=Nocardioides sp. YIM 152588 TaxID=3158259 RepID=UPI0032E4FC94
MDAGMGEQTGRRVDAASTPGRPDVEAISLPVVLRFVDVAVDALAAAREEIDALNVYPVPDGDTGTNMYLTMVSARDAIRDATDRPTGEALAAFARGALLGARGNSGVILSEMLGALARRFADPAPTVTYAVQVAEALDQASHACYAAVGEPVEGTMLTVLRAAATAAVEAADRPGSPARDVFTAAAASAREALVHTPEQLDVLARAGVVDAGGQGMCVLLDAAEQVFAGRRPAERPVVIGHRAPPAGAPVPVPAPATADGAGGDATGAEAGPAYEVMYLLDAEPEAARRLRARLGEIGESVVVVGADRLWNVHVHTDDPGLAVESALEDGRPHRIRITHFAEQAAGGESHAEPVAAAPALRRVVAVSAGPGLSDLFAEAGAVVVEGGAGRRPSTGELLEAIAASGAREVVVLPNDENTVRAAQAAATTAEADDPRGIRVAVIPSYAQVQGLAALAVHDPGRGFDQDVTEMTATARHVRHGAVTIAARTAMTMAGPCEPGDVLGVIAGDFAVVGSNRVGVARVVLERLLAAGGELVTLVAGEDGGDELAEAITDWVETQHPHVDVVTYRGGQQRYPLLLSVE